MSSYTDIPMDDYPLSVDEIDFIRTYIENDDSKTTNEHAAFYANIPAATGSDATNMTSYPSKPVVIPLPQ